MAASDEFPRAASQTSGLQNSPANPAITLPASPGISHVVTDIFGLVFGGAGAASGGAAQIIVTDGVQSEALSLMGFTGVNGLTTASWSGKFIGQAGSAVTIEQSTGLPANYFGLVTCNWYDM